MAAHAVDAQGIGAGGRAANGLTPPPALPAIEGYEVRQQIGETPASDVYLAAHTTSGVLRTIAVQRTEKDPAATRRIVREVLEASRVKHPGVALVDGVGTTRDGRLYVATAYVPGTTLAELLEGEGHLPGRRAVQIALRAAEALEAAHKLGVVHGDLTPEHIIVGPAGADGTEPVAVTGFGMTTARTGSASIVEPPKQARPYASPERVSGGYLDARSDVFSLASIMLHALSGNAPPPPRAATGRGVTPTSSAAIQPGARLAPAQVLLAARAAEPDRRYPSAAVFRDTLAAAFGEGDESRRTPDGAHAIARVTAPAPRPTPPTEAARRATPAAPPAAVSGTTTPRRVTPVNPFLRPTPAYPGAAAAQAVEPPRPARWDLPVAELQAPSGLVADPFGIMEAAAPPATVLPAATALPDEPAESTLELTSSSYTPAAYDTPSVHSPAGHTPPAGPSFGHAPSAAASFPGERAPARPVSSPLEQMGAGHAPPVPARRRGMMMIGGAIAATIVLGAWGMSARAPKPVTGAAAPTAVAADAPVGVPVAVAESAGGKPAGATRGTIVGAAGRQQAAPAATGEAPAAGAPEVAEIAPMPKVVVPDVAMRGDVSPGATGLSQGALSEVAATAGASSLDAPSTGPVIDAATRSQINAAMARFARALESRDMGTLQDAYPSITVTERNTWSSFFRSAESVRARFTAQDFQVMPDGVDINAVGKLTFNKRDSRQQTENAVTFRVLLARSKSGGYVMKKIH